MNFRPNTFRNYFSFIWLLSGFFLLSFPFLTSMKMGKTAEQLAFSDTDSIQPARDIIFLNASDTLVAVSDFFISPSILRGKVSQIVHWHNGEKIMRETYQYKQGELQAVQSQYLKNWRNARKQPPSFMSAKFGKTGALKSRKRLLQSPRANSWWLREIEQNGPKYFRGAFRAQWKCNEQANCLLDIRRPDGNRYWEWRQEDAPLADIRAKSGFWWDPVLNKPRMDMSGELTIYDANEKVMVKPP